MIQLKPFANDNEAMPTKASNGVNERISYKDNHRREGIRTANARPKVIIFCKSWPSDC